MMRARLVERGTVRCVEVEGCRDSWVMELRGQHVEDGSSGTAVSDKAEIARSPSTEARTLPLVI